MPNFEKSEAYNLAKEKLIKSGCSEENTHGIVDGILDAEFSGIKSHGFHYLPIYCNHLKIGKIITILGKKFKGYYWNQNYGYGTKQHLKAIRNLGITTHHRKTFSPMNKIK